MANDNDGFADAGAGVGPPPPPGEAFHWTRETYGFALRARLLDPLAHHVFTSSQLRLPANAAPADRERAWSSVAASLSASPGQLLRVRQVHGRAVRVVRRDDPAAPDLSLLPDGDAVASDVAGLVLAVVVADCVPLLLVDPRRGAAAAVHAGWRGTCAGVASSAMEAMRGAWGTRPEDVRAAVGPSIGPSDYQVGESVVDAFRAAGHGAAQARWFSRGGDGSTRLDLWRANADQLEAAGVLPGHIVTAGLSTAAHPGWFESYRRDGAAAGRLVAAVVVPPPGARRV